jgi:methylated-DNA-[protein]-cysteine S-methyltransferase
MEKVVITSTNGYVLIDGNEDGISKISVTSDKTVLSESIPVIFTDVVLQLQDNFDGNCTNFQFEMNPKRTDFQKKVWKELLKILLGKTASYL